MAGFETVNWWPKGNGWNQLHLSASSGDIPTLRQLIKLSKEGGEDAKLQVSSSKVSKLDIPIKSGDRAIHLALRKGQSDAVRELIKAGCDVKALGSGGESVVHIAARKGMLHELNWFIDEFGMDVKAVTKDGSTCMHLAAAEDRCDTLRALYALDVPLDAQNDAAETALHVAARSGSVGAVMWILDKDPSLLRKQNKQGKDAEAVARDAGRREAAAVLLEAKQAKKRVARNVADFHKLLGRGENLATVKEWLGKASPAELDTLVNTTSVKTGMNAMLEACHGGDLDVVKYIASIPGKRDTVNMKNGITALQIAAGRGDLPLVEYLLSELQLDPSREDARGVNALQEAIRCQQTEVIRVLKEYEEKRRELRQRTPMTRVPSSTTISRPPSATPRQLSETSEFPSSEESSERSTLLHRQSSGASIGSEAGMVDDEVIAVLQRAELSVSYYAPKLQEAGFNTLSHLLLVMEADLQEMGMRRGHKRALLAVLDSIKAQKKREETSFQEVIVPQSPIDAGKNGRSSALRAPMDGGNVHATNMRIHVNDLRYGAPKELPDQSQFELVVPSADPQKEPKIYFVGRHGRTFSCSCVSWRMQAQVPAERRTCEHLKAIRGDQAEKIRTEAGSFATTTTRNTPGFGGSRESSADRFNPSQFGSQTSTSLSRMSEQSKQRLQEMRKLRSETSTPDPEVPRHFIVKWEELDLEDQIFGEGSFGVVRIATFRGMQVAVKELKISNSHDHSIGDELRDLKREALTMSRVCNHDNVVPLVGMVLAPVPSVVMPFMPGGSVEDLLVLPGPRSIRHLVPWFAVLKMIRDAAAGVLHLHAQGVIHRDLSARNLLVDATGAVRVSDFGFARIKESNSSRQYTISHIGPIKWMAPEAILNKRFSEKSDVFSFGVTMWEILMGQRPWKELEAVQAALAVISEKKRMRLPRSPDPNVPKLIEKCWAQDENSRPNMRQVFKEVDTAWREANGHLAADPSGGVASIIKSESFLMARTIRPNGNYAEFQSGDSRWLGESSSVLESEEFFLRQRPSLGYTTPGPEERSDSGDEGYSKWLSNERAPASVMNWASDAASGAQALEPARPQLQARDKVADALKALSFVSGPQDPQRKLA